MKKLIVVLVLIAVVLMMGVMIAPAVEARGMPANDCWIPNQDICRTNHADSASYSWAAEFP